MADRIAVRCDGTSAHGAGHVARCLPISEALIRRGLDVRFVGHYDGLARWLLEQHGATFVAPGRGPCGLRPEQWAGALVDLYLEDGRETEVCALAGVLPIATPGEASRCAESGLWIDYHVASRPEASERRLGGPAFAPLDRRFVAARRPRPDAKEILVTVGGSDRFDAIAVEFCHAASTVFPDARIHAAPRIAEGLSGRVLPLPAPVELVSVAREIDIAVTAAGMTVYELASAGIACVAAVLADNQRIVADGCGLTGIAIPVDGQAPDLGEAAQEGLRALRDPETRATVAAAGQRILDGRGAERIADALVRAWARA